MSGKVSPVLLHVSACLLFLLLPFLFAPESEGLLSGFINAPTQRDFISYFLLIGIFYSNYYFLIPRFYIRKQWIVFIAANVAAFALVTFFPNVLVPQEGPGPGGQPPTFFMDLSHHFFLFLVVVFLSLALVFNDRWKQTEKEKLYAELAYLKAQVNPHFLFNTLNGIYALALEKSDQTPEAIARLATMMRYVLYEAEKERVPLEKEIGYIRDYIHLQEMRFDDALSLDFTCTGDPTGQRIAPLVLIPFIENAFKHGVNAEENSHIRIRLEIHPGRLYLEVYNHKVTTRGEPGSGGLGIENTRQRLEHLYPGRYNLDIRNAAGDFHVLMNLQV